MKNRFDHRMKARRTVLRALSCVALACAVAAPGGTHAASAAETAPAGAHCAAPGAGKRVTMLVQLAGPNLATDQRVKTHLEARGYNVRLVDEAQPVDAAADADLVVISSTVSSKRVGSGWRALAKPLLTWENDMLDSLAMTGKRHDVDFGATANERYLWLVNAPHPIAAGLPAGKINVYGKRMPMSWGKPGLGATIIATVYGEPGKAAIFAYEKGATMDYESLAPERRVMFLLDNDTFGNLSPEGVALFDAAVDWAAGARCLME